MGDETPRTVRSLRSVSSQVNGAEIRFTPVVRNSSSSHNYGRCQSSTRDHVLFKTPLRMLTPKYPCRRPIDSSESDLKTSILWTPQSFCDTVD
ncbi:unnamed protein product, partial [Timema podura]|nr:unnamed protein product [Timema podura]